MPVQLKSALLITAILAPACAQNPIQPAPGIELYPPNVPITPQRFTPAQLLAAEARWIRNQVWATGPVAAADTALLPRSYDVTSGYGLLNTDYFSWLLEHNDSYFQFDASHNDHRADVPLDHSNDAPIERVLMAWGSSGYDAATWAIAMAAAQRCAVFSAEDKADFTRALNAYLRVLVTASYPGGLRSYRAWDADGSRRWHYGESGQDAAFGSDAQGRALDARNAFHWQFAPARWQNPDPHWDPLAPAGAVLNWPGWAVITGEEAWAAFLGPMQVARCLNPGTGWSAASAPVPALSLVENACRELHGVELMQNSVTGGIYRQVGAPDQPADSSFPTSVENNWSVYTGLGFLERALADLQASPPQPGQTPDLDPAEAIVTVRRIRTRMGGFFRNRALVWHAKGEPFGDPAAVDYGFFLQGTTGMAGAAVGVTSAFATDVQTWGIAAILGDRALERDLEGVYGRHFLHDMFKAAIGLGGYYGTAPGGARILEGIGFNAQKAGAPEAQLSGEWTWGAINAAMLLAEFYQESGRQDPARVTELMGQARSMIAGVNRLASHDYNPRRLKDGRDWVGYLYANRRAWIPWGWFSNACPSQAATTWALMVNSGFNPFELGGGDHRASVKALGLAGTN